MHSHNRIQKSSDSDSFRYQWWEQASSYLGKALGGASGGYTAARQEVIDMLRQKSRPYLKASSEVYTGKVNTMSDITNRSLTLSSTTHTMSTGSIVYNNTGSRRWYIRGEIRDVKYEMVAYTSLKAVLNVTGIISR